MMSIFHYLLLKIVMITIINYIHIWYCQIYICQYVVRATILHTKFMVDNEMIINIILRYFRTKGIFNEYSKFRF
ncbi:hypothetical protein VISI1226_14078 [Vibrio sinaloensis DSM 21326]|uniref:Uncharacterized protein n=1 Tax=Vibrio sinaloensis DSM 21326 TaxID=945550 RepID=E8M228_PHOS4|nr:hypothetical protein VISI1226_14078 [Vibrio sinaloensis DSM 21326]